jgi:hypothetical protein
MTNKYLILLLVLSLFSGFLQAQSQEGLLEKAHVIAQFMGVKEKHLFLKTDEVSTSTYIPLLKAAIGSDSTATLADLLDSLGDNPFIGRGQSAAKVWILADPQTSLGAFTTRTGVQHKSAPNFSVTTVADGIAKFLVTRVKEELSIAFFKQFQEDLKQDTFLSTVFPATTSTLALVGSDVYQFNLYLASLRESFDKDVKTLPVNFRAYIMDTHLIKSPKYQILLEDALLLSQDLIDGQAPDEVINYFATQASIQQSSRIELLPKAEQGQMVDLAAGLKVLNLLSQSLYTSESGKNGWLDPATVSQYLSEPNTRIVYLALLWQHSSNITFSDTTTVQSYLTKMAIIEKKGTQLVSLLKTFSQNCDDAEKAIADYQKDGASMNYEPYYRFIEAVLTLLETGVQFKTTIAEIAGDSTDQRFLSGIRHLNELNFDVRQKNYAASVNDLVYVLQSLLPEMSSARREKVFKYGHFIAAVASAENSDQVAAAIDAVAIPPGSSKVKKQNYFSSAIQAYTGVAAGGENLSGVGESTFAALSAPVGISCSWKFRDLAPTKKGKKRTPGSFSLFAPVIDVGALVSYRFNDPNSNDLPELKWSNLLSPGLYAVFGCRNNLPISLGLGAQRGPNLRKVTSGTLDQTASAWRYGMFLSVDIPVFNLAVQPRKK